MHLLQWSSIGKKYNIFNKNWDIFSHFVDRLFCMYLPLKQYLNFNYKNMLQNCLIQTLYFITELQINFVIVSFPERRQLHVLVHLLLGKRRFLQRLQELRAVPGPQGQGSGQLQGRMEDQDLQRLVLISPRPYFFVNT